MRKILHLILLAGIFFISCEKKTRNVHFYGRAYIACDGSPISNEEVKIFIAFDAGHSASEVVATPVTNGNGDYSVVADVSHPGDFEYYSVRMTNSHFDGGAQTYGESEDSKDIHLDIPCSVLNKANFHFKNIQPPVDATDILYQFYYSPDSINMLAYYNLNLQGTAIDTIIPKEFNVGRVYYKYFFKKNGIDSFSPVSYFDIECNGDDVNIDVFY